ncbi:histidine--tRNA ligase [soil metagenome]
MSTNQELPQTLKGFRDFLPMEKRKRDYVESKMKVVFERFGFAPLETPTLEYASLLLGKYGDEADKLLYTFEDRGDRKIGLRYDQTVPTARVLSQYQNELPKFFRRYQIQDVFRADKPQKGRYREFKQCDLDIYGTTSPIADAEVLAVVYFTFKEIGFDSIVLQINDRQTLMSTLSPFTTPEVDVFSLIQSIDKLDKLTPAEVVSELMGKGLTQEKADAAVITIDRAEASENLQAIVNTALALGVPKAALRFNPKIARGLDYYTGLIFEATVPEYLVGSVGGGGRYDNLIKDLSGLEMPATGFAFGFDRTVEAAEQLGLIPLADSAVKVLVTVFDTDDKKIKMKSFVAASAFRAAGIPTEVFPAEEKLGKQFKFADQTKIPFVIIIGEEEAAQDKVMLKNMSNGEQVLLSIEEVITSLLHF